MPDEPILPIDHPMLSLPSELVEHIDEGTRRLVEEMFRVMDRATGAGLAAVQIGAPARVVVMDAPDAEGTRHRLAMVNPRVVTTSGGTVVGEEGCLSMPGYEMPVSRHKRVEVAFIDLDGQGRFLVATGPLAVCVQHEVDHTDGVLFFDRVSRLRRQRARDYFGKVRRRHEADLRLS